MKVISTQNLHEKLTIDNEEVVLNGTPDALIGHIKIRNSDKEGFFIRELPLKFIKKGKNNTLLKKNIFIQTALAANESRMHHINYQMPSDTPPGEYEEVIDLGENQKKLRIIVQPNIDISLNPLSLQFLGVKPGKSYSAEITCTNQGNVPFKIPNIKHSTVLDEDYLCRSVSNAIRSKGGEGYHPVMDELVKDIYNQMAGWVTLKLDESGKTVAPSSSLQLHFHLTLPKENVDPNRDYFGNVRIWDQILSFSIKSI